MWPWSVGAAVAVVPYVSVSVIGLRRWGVEVVVPPCVIQEIVKQLKDLPCRNVHVSTELSCRWWNISVN